MRISGSMFLDVVPVGITSIRLLQLVRQTSWKAHGVSATADPRAILVMRLLQHANLRIQVLEAHGDAEALEGEGSLVGDQRLASTPL